MKKMKLKSNEITQEMADSWNSTFEGLEHDDVHTDTIILFDGLKFYKQCSTHGIDDTEFIVMDYGCGGDEIHDMIDEIGQSKFSVNDLKQYLKNTDRV